MPGRRRPVDIVAIVLASALGAMLVLIMLATTAQILFGGAPQIELSDNATQVLVGGIGALTGLLGGYIGARRGRHNDDGD